MKKIIILYPHFPPSNLAGVHRARLFAQHLPSYGWDPIVLTVHEKNYEEKPDWNLVKLVAPELRIEKVGAIPLTRPRLIGDIGLRSFFQLYTKAKSLIKKEKIDFLFIPIPSFYPALLGRWLHQTTGVRYAIDYIDPWVHQFPGSERFFSRHWFSTKLARFLEPIAVKKASLITGVAKGYYQPVLDRNRHLKGKIITGAMPYGGEENDHDVADKLQLRPYLFSKSDKIQLVYAGAMLPKAYLPLEIIFKEIEGSKNMFKNVELHFIGTGFSVDSPKGFNIKSLAQKYGLWESVVFEYPARIPYMDVLTHLAAADGVFILGSTEPHYTPSKTYQAVLSKKPILAVLHAESTAVGVVRNSGAGLVLDFNGEPGIEKIGSTFLEIFSDYLSFISRFNPADVDKSLFEMHSAKSVTGMLVNLLNEACKIKV